MQQRTQTPLPASDHEARTISVLATTIRGTDSNIADIVAHQLAGALYRAWPTEDDHLPPDRHAALILEMLLRNQGDVELGTAELRTPRLQQAKDSLTAALGERVRDRLNQARDRRPRFDRHRAGAQRLAS